MPGEAPPQGINAQQIVLIGPRFHLNVVVMKHVVSIALVFTLAGCAGNMPDLRNGGLLKGLKRERNADPIQTAPSVAETPTPMQQTIALHIGGTGRFSDVHLRWSGHPQPFHIRFWSR